MMQASAITIVAEHPNGSTCSSTVDVQQSVLVGQSNNCGLQLTGDGIGEIHCRISFEDGQLFVQDWMSEIGTEVNGEQISSKTSLERGSQVAIGPYQLRFREAQSTIGEDAPSEHPTTEAEQEPSPTNEGGPQQDQSTERSTIFDRLNAAEQANQSALQGLEPSSQDSSSDQVEDSAPEYSDTAYSDTGSSLAVSPPTDLQEPQESSETSASSVASPEYTTFQSNDEISAESDVNAECAPEEIASVEAEPTEHEFEQPSPQTFEDVAPSVSDTDPSTDCESRAEIDTDTASTPGGGVADAEAEEFEEMFFADDQDLFGGEETTYDRETVELLQAEIDDLRSQLAERDAGAQDQGQAETSDSLETDDSDTVRQRIDELVEEANRADERVMILEEMLLAADDAGQAEAEERTQLEAWVGDIERRIGQREQEHMAELDAVKQRMQDAEGQVSNLRSQLKQSASGGEFAVKKYEQSMEVLQEENRKLLDQIADSEKEVRQLQQQIGNQSEEIEAQLREERAKIAKEQAEMSRLKFEYAERIKEIEERLSKATVIDPRLQALHDHRKHLREASEQRKKEPQNTAISSRLKSLWDRVR